MKIRVVCAGKVKESYYREAIREFLRRLSRYCNIEIYEVDDEKTPDAASSAEEDQIRIREGGRLLRGIPDQSYCIALAIEGRKLDSVGLSRSLEELFARGKSQIVFVIGGSLGLSSEVLSRADMKLSFSDMTFPHQLMRVILLEQVYRSFRIMRHEPYHK